MTSYLRFGLMIAVSTIVMFGLMYLNTYAFDHIFYSQTRMWTAVVMGAVMAAIMLVFMWAMYKNTRINVAILEGSAIAYAVAMLLVRSHEHVGGAAYMNAMLLDHSLDIMNRHA